jgi:hypothetical protein
VSQNEYKIMWQKLSDEVESLRLKGVKSINLTALAGYLGFINGYARHSLAINQNIESERKEVNR